MEQSFSDLELNKEKIDEIKKMPQSEIEKLEKNALAGNTVNQLQDQIDTQNEKVKNEEKQIADEFENLLNRAFDQYEKKNEDGSDPKADNHDNNYFLEIDYDQEIISDLEGNLSLLNGNNEVRFDEAEAKKETEEKYAQTDVRFFSDFESDMENAELNHLNLLQVKDFTAMEARLKDSLEKNFESEITDKNKNKMLFELIFHLSRVAQLDKEKAKKKVKNKDRYQLLGLEGHGICNVYLENYADKKFIRYLLEEQLSHYEKVRILYLQNLEKPVPHSYLENKNADPRDKELVKQYAVHMVRNTDAFQELKCINEILEALCGMSEGFESNIGVDNVPGYVQEIQKELIEKKAPEDKNLITENRTFFNMLKFQKLKGISNAAQTNDENIANEKLERDLRRFLKSNKLIEDFELPPIVYDGDFHKPKLDPGECWPPIKKDESFSAEHKNAVLFRRMALLLSMEDQVREVWPATKNENGELKSGVLLKQHPGTKVSEALRQGRELSSDAKKQIADIVMLNLICGNVQNPEENLIVENASNDSNILAVREAFGTEKSFGENAGKAILAAYGGGGEMSLRSLGNLSPEMKAKILNLSPAMLTTLFEKDLTKRQMDALLSRLSAVKELIRSFESNRKNDQVFAAKKIRKYIRGEKNRSDEEKFRDLPQKYDRIRLMLNNFQQRSNTLVNQKLQSAGNELFPQERKRVKKALDKREPMLRGVLMNQVDRYLALSRSKDFADKLHKNDPAAISVMRDYEQRILDGEALYKAQMQVFADQLEGLDTKEKLLEFAVSQEVLIERNDYFANVQASRYKNNEDSDSMYFVKESVRVLSERAIDSTIRGAEELQQYIGRVDEQYRFAIQKCEEYIESHTPLIRFWTEDGRKRFEMVQALKERLTREQNRINTNGAIMLQKMVSGEEQYTSFKELLVLGELRAAKLAVVRRKEDFKAEEETSKNGSKARDEEACIKETVIDEKAVKDAVDLIQKFGTQNFIQNLKISSDEEILKNRAANAAVFSKLEKAFSVVRDYMLLGGAFDGEEPFKIKVKEEDQPALRLNYHLLKRMKGVVEKYYEDAKNLALHPLRFSKEAEEADTLPPDQLERRKEDATGDLKAYLNLLISCRKSKEAAFNLTKLTGVANLVKETKTKVGEKSRAGFFKELLEAAPDPKQEKDRILYHLNDVYKEEKNRKKNNENDPEKDSIDVEKLKKPPLYLVAYLWGKTKDEIRLFALDLFSKDDNKRKAALKKIVEKAAKDPITHLENTTEKPSRMFMNAEYNYGLAIRGATLKDAFDDLKNMSDEKPEQEEEVNRRIALAEEYKLKEYETRYKDTKNLLKNSTDTGIERIIHG